MLYMDVNKTIWIEANSSNKKDRKIIDLRKMYNMCDKSILSALPGWFSFTGTSHEPAFYGKTKKYCFKILLKDKQAQLAFSLLGDAETHAVVVEGPLEKYTCNLYNSVLHGVNEARVGLFTKAYTQGKGFNDKGIITSQAKSYR